MYYGVINGLRESEVDPEVSVTVITGKFFLDNQEGECFAVMNCWFLGTGDYFSSGYDFTEKLTAFAQG